MKVTTEKVLKNQIRRSNKRDRERARKLSGTYIHKKPGTIINKWGKPYYERVRVETPWKKCLSKNSKYRFWVNPVTGQILEDFDLTGSPDPHIHYVDKSTGPFAEITPLPPLSKVRHQVEN